MLCSSNQLLSFQLENKNEHHHRSAHVKRSKKTEWLATYALIFERKIDDKKTEKTKSNDETIINRSFHLYILKFLFLFLLNLISLIDCMHV